MSEVSASALRKIASLGFTAEQMVGMLELLADGLQADEDRRASQRERTRKSRAKRDGDVTVTLQSQHGNVTSPVPLSLDKENPPAPPKEIKPKTPLPPNSPAFEAFWDLFPNKVGKVDASKAFSKALLTVDFETIMAGLRRYVAKTDDRPWCNPKTFLGQGRWDDQPAAVARGSPQRVNPTIDAGERLLAEMRAANGTSGTDYRDYQRLVGSVPERR